jgi:Protein of unknown function (DUF2911)
MKLLRLFSLLIAAALLSKTASAEQTRTSPHETTSTVFGDRHTGNRVTLIYGRPYSKDPKTGAMRVIWGSLVPWDAPYRLGADEATMFITQQAIVVGDATIPAGAYSLYLIPSEKGASKLVFSKSVGQWGAPVDTGHDFAQVEVARGALDSQVDQLTLSIDKDPSGGGTLKIQWEKTQFAVSLHPPAPRIDLPQASPTADLKQRVGVTDIEIVYSRPSAKGRVMLGGLNPYGQVWRTGANNATRVTFSTPVSVEHTALAAGTYELFTIPGKDQWTVIFQKASDQWGAYAYDQKNDVARVVVAPKTLAEPVETFEISLGDLRDDSASLNLTWERTQVTLRLGVDTVGRVKPQIDAAMAGTGKKPYAQAAIFYLEHGLDLAQAKAWMASAIEGNPKFFYLYYHQARILAKMGDKDGAIASAKRSMELAAAETGPAKDEYLRLNQTLINSLK